MTPLGEALVALVHGRSGDPFALLGPHRGSGGDLVVRALLPQAESVELCESDGTTLAAMERVHPAGLFAGPLPAASRDHYRLAVQRGTERWLLDDPYRFGPLLRGEDLALLREGRHWRAQQVLGAHPCRHQGVEGVRFAVWAPNARRVSVVGPFNDWDGRRHPMRLRHDAGVWELFIPGLAAGEIYKYELLDRGWTLLPLKADPYGFAAERPPATASIVARLDEHPWGDAIWRAGREHANARDAPIAIYELHLGSWQRHPDGRQLSYGEIADRLIPYVQELGFTHIELLPITEHPFDGSWGYQPVGLFAATSRFGPPRELQALIDRCHQAGIGVLLDWVPGHFPNDAHGLARFDGTQLYEHADPRLGEHRDWGTLIYNLGRREVANLLLASALHWLETFHFDGLRIDAVASMLYLDYSRQPGEWVPNIHGGRENLESIAFLRQLNELTFGQQPGTTTIAEESTAWPMVSRPTYLGGLGFGFKWNMGWMHDTLGYIGKDPIHRRHHHNQLTFGLVYAFSENFVLPLSHDEVVHGKGSLLGRMPGDRWQRFANLRAYLAFFYGHPGKKLLFMGGEFGQEREWNHDRALDWHLLDDPAHLGVQRLVGDLNRAYRARGALHELDCEPAGFEWIDGADAAQSVLSFLRRGRNPGDSVVVVGNFTPIVRHDYRIGVPQGGHWRELLNSDAQEYGGSGVGNAGQVEALNQQTHGRPFTLSLTLPPLAVLFLAPEAA